MKPPVPQRLPPPQRDSTPTNPLPLQAQPNHQTIPKEKLPQADCLYLTSTPTTDYHHPSPRRSAGRRPSWYHRSTVSPELTASPARVKSTRPRAILSKSCALLAHRVRYLLMLLAGQHPPRGSRRSFRRARLVRPLSNSRYFSCCQRRFAPTLIQPVIAYVCTSTFLGRCPSPVSSAWVDGSLLLGHVL